MTRAKCTFQSAVLILCGLIASPASAQITIGYPGPYGRGAYDLTSSVRLEVTPRTADVFVDGYYAGKVDEFDGTFQRLRVEPGEHEIQLFLPGYRLYSEKVYLQPGNTFKVRHAMERLGPGEAEPTRPVAAARPSPGGARPQTPRDRAITSDEAGSVAIRVQPAAATVLIDGQRWETSEDEALTVQLSPGRHTIEVRKAGFRGYLTEVNIEPGRVETLNVSLSPE